MSDAQAEEGGPYNPGLMVFTVTLSPPAAHEVTVGYGTRDGTARGDLYGRYGDYTETSGQLRFAAGETSKTVTEWVSVSGNGAVALRTLNENDLLANSSFALASPSGSGGLLSFWGRGAVSNFDGRDGELSLDGEVTTWLLGTDWSWDQWQGTDARRTTAGLLLSRRTAHGGYGGRDTSGDVGDGGDVRTTLTGVFPWARHRFTERLEAWAAAGFGQGDLAVTPKPTTGEDGATLSTALNLWLAAAGLRGTLLDGGQ